MFDLLVSIFGKKSAPTLKYLRMMYWLPKLRHISPWSTPETRINDEKEAAELAIKRMGSVDLENEITVFYVSIIRHDLTWLLSQVVIIPSKYFRRKMMNCRLKIRGL